MENQVIVSRDLFYSLKGNEVRKKFTFKVCEPKLVEENMVSFKFDEGTAICTAYFEGLDEENIEIYGMDKLHALSQALDVDRFLKSFTTKYDFYWITGEPYFE